MADKIVVMRDGRVEQMGTPLDLYDTPANTFVAGFIGSPAMNLIEGMVLNGRVELGNNASIPTPIHSRAVEGQKVLLGVRPEHLSVGDGNATLNAQVQVVEPTGADTQVSCTVGKSNIIVMLRDRLSARAGDPIMLQADLTRSHLFDAASGARLAA